MSLSGITKDLVTFNVGGRLFTTTRANINGHPNSMLANLIAHTADGDSQQEIFIDRDPDTFAVILRYLRTGVVDITKDPVAPAVLAADGAFYLLPQVVAEAKKLMKPAPKAPLYYLYSCCSWSDLTWEGRESTKTRPMHRVTAVDATSTQLHPQKADLVERLDNWRLMGKTINVSFFDNELERLMSNLNAVAEKWAIHAVRLNEYPLPDGQLEHRMYCIVKRL
ncbi:BTB/POZ protein [Gaertneriomyces semiglobifer]|nr:BTB/POZ protein [Gaertneriomyces semiglobifer]